MKWSLPLILFIAASFPACNDKGKVVSEDSLIEQSEPDASDFLSALMLPGIATLSSGKTVSFETLGRLPYDQTSNISKRGVWTIADRSILTEYEDGTPGRFRARLPGTTAVTFTMESITTTGTVTVTDKLLEMLKISLDEVSLDLEGTQNAYIAEDFAIKVFGIYSDGSTEDLTVDAIWSSEDDLRFQSIGEGKFKVLGPTTTRVNVKVNEITSSIPVVIKSLDRHFTGFSFEPAPLILPKNTNMPLMLKAHYSNGESEDVTSQASLQLSNPALATIANPTGARSLQGTSLGSGDFLVSYEGHNEVYPFHVVEAEAQTLAVSSPSKNFQFAIGDKEHFTSSLIYSDGTVQNITSLTSWSSEDLSILNKTGTGADFGYFKANTAGVTQLKASFGGLSTSSEINVTPSRLESITISSLTTGVLGQFTSRTYTAKALYTDGSRPNLTTGLTKWSYIKGGVKTAFASKGVLDAVATATQGPITIEVESQGVIGTLTVTVGPPVPVSIDITINLLHDNIYVVRNLADGPVQLIATVLYSDNTTSDLTASATWSYDVLTAPFIFAGYVRNEDGFKGLLTPLELGMFRVSATFGGVTGSKIVRIE